MAPKVMDPELAAIAAALAADSTPSDVVFLKDGDTTLKLVLPEGRTRVSEFYERFEATFKEGKFPYYLIAAVVFESDTDGQADQERVKFVKVTKTVMQDILNLLTKGWKLFAANGPMVTITKGKKGPKVVYQVAAIPLEFDATGKPFPSKTIVEAAKDQETRSAEMDSKPADEGEKLK